MNRLATLLPLLALAAALSAQTPVADTQVGDFLFHMPDGWTQAQKGDMTYLYAPGSTPQHMSFIAMAANDPEGDLAHSFDVLWGGFKGAYRVLQGGEAKPVHRNGYDGYHTTAVALDQNRVLWEVYVLGAQYQQRIETVMFMSNLPVGEERSSHERALKTFLDSMSFGAALPGGNKTVLPPDEGDVVTDKPHNVPPGMLEGVYIGMTIGTGGHVRRSELIFNPDGWVVKGVPQESMIGFDFTAYRNSPDTNRSWVGRYRVSGNKLSIVWQDYTDDRSVFTLNESGVSPGLDIYVPMCRCTGKHFSGKYNWGLAGSGQYMQFFPDGTFLDHGVLDQMIVPNNFYDHPRIRTGRYTIRDQTIVFTFADGTRGTRTFYAPKAQESKPVFDWIGLGWDQLFEEHYQSEP